MRGILSRRVLVSLGAVAFVVGIIMTAVGVLSVLDSPDKSAANLSLPSAATATATAAPDTTPTPAATLSATVTDTPSPTPEPTPPLGETPFRMVIESIGVDAPVETYGLDANAIPEVPTDYNSDNPAGIVAWYSFSGEPGTGDNAVFSGHVTWFGKAVFWDLNKLEIGDTIKLKGENGAELVYAVSDSFLVDPTDPEAVRVMDHATEDIITLITCDGAFVDTGDPVFGGEYSDRRVIRAELMSITGPDTPAGPYEP